MHYTTNKFATLLLTTLACSYCTAVVAESSKQSTQENSETKSKRLIKQPGQKRPKNQYQTTIFDRPLTIGGEIGTDLDWRKGFELDDSEQDDKTMLNGDVELELFLQWSQRVSVLIEPRWSFERDLDADDDNRQSDSFFRRGQSWIYVDGFKNKNVAIQVGRQTFRDKREWWWDSDLDAFRVHYDSKNIVWEMALANELAKIASNEDDIRPRDKDIVRLLGAVTWEWRKKQSLSAFFTYQNDKSNSFIENQIIDEQLEDESDASLMWLGARAMGREKVKGLGKLHYWLDIGRVEGDEELIDFDNNDSTTSIVDEVDQIDVSGWGVDFGVTLQTKLSGNPSITLGYAKGSGDNDLQDRSDKSFRQTDLQDNDGRFRNVNRFRYYGELLRPELSNLTITTLAIGFRHHKNSSTELVYHRYTQVNPADFLRDDALRDRPNGEKKNIGQEIDLVIGIEESRRWEWEIVASAFKAGNAFGNNSGEMAYKLRVSVDYNF